MKPALPVVGWNNPLQPQFPCLGKVVWGARGSENLLNIRPELAHAWHLGSAEQRPEQDMVPMYVGQLPRHLTKHCNSMLIDSPSSYNPTGPLGPQHCQVIPHPP